MLCPRGYVRSGGHWLARAPQYDKWHTPALSRIASGRAIVLRSPTRPRYNQSAKTGGSSPLPNLSKHQRPPQEHQTPGVSIVPLPPTQRHRPRALSTFVRPPQIQNSIATRSCLRCWRIKRVGRSLSVASSSGSLTESEDRLRRNANRRAKDDAAVGTVLPIPAGSMLPIPPGSRQTSFKSSNM
jgi:hypothetical protein